MRRQIALATIVAFTLTFVGGPLVQPAAAQVPAPAGISLPITGSGPGGTFDGVLNLQRFTVVNGAITAIGTLTGTATTTGGQVISIVRNFAVPINAAATQATCSILHLELGPLNLDLLGLVVDLNQVVLDVTAVAGAGNLLGNLLCAVAGLLDGSGPLGSVAFLLNRILSILA
jgi:hypothetical protein